MRAEDEIQRLIDEAAEDGYQNGYAAGFLAAAEGDGETVVVNGDVRIYRWTQVGGIDDEGEYDLVQDGPAVGERVYRV